MIDLHSHILPGIDDGARSITDTLAIAENSVEAGVTHMVCTPHIHLGTFNNTVESISNAFEVAVNALHEHNIPLKLAMGSEVRITPEILPLVSNKQLPYIGTWRGKHALLLELPHSHIPAGVENLIKWLIKHNVQPVIPHPERNRDILANYSKAKWLKQLGCIFQITAGALVNRFSEAVHTTAWQMQQDNLLTYVASDTHNVHKRPNDMQAAYNAVEQRTNDRVANALFK
ncbi:MAG: CpsB/CapC family capsule biosynthesis tyrosine phosphatase, partial [Glaciecola sp.]